MGKSTQTLGLLACILMIAACTHREPSITIEHNDKSTTVHINGKCSFLMLPIQEDSKEARVRATDAAADVPKMDIRLAMDEVDYYVPFELTGNRGTHSIIIEGLDQNALCWKCLKTADKIEFKNSEEFRPQYHHTPKTGWMNDPNGMVYKDGRYHLYYQYNPYGSKWGNMHWAHASSTDLIHWEHHGIAISRDTLGHIYSGSAVVDKLNTSGFGKDALVAIYTSHNDKAEVQSIAYSTDNGMTFTKYEGNPVLVAEDGIRDFRDPKVFWFEPDEKWVMVLSAREEVRFFSSRNLKDWEYTGAFGKGFGAHSGCFECPDLVQLPVDGTDSGKKWMLIVNINPGGPFGGSATQYFTGDFDGNTFVCDTAPEVTKWMDYGKDHYATVTFSNTGERVIALAWMSNWQYAKIVPTKQFRSSNSIPRDISLFTCPSGTYAASSPSEEVTGLRKSAISFNAMTLEQDAAETIEVGAQPFELSFTINPVNANSNTLTLSNSKGEKLYIIFDYDAGLVSVDRNSSGLMTDNPGFSTITSAPLTLCNNADGYQVRVFVDRSSVELFVDNGRIAMTSLVFPEEYYSEISLSSLGGAASVQELNIYELGL